MRRHTPHLTISAFADGELNPAIRDTFTDPNRRQTRPRLGYLPERATLRRTRWPIVQRNATNKLQRMRLGRYALHLRPVSLRHPGLIASNRRLQHAVISQQQQSLAVRIQPPSSVDIRNVDELRQRALMCVAGELRENVEGFVEKDEHGALTKQRHPGALCRARVERHRGAATHGLTQNRNKAILKIGAPIS